MNLLIHSTIEDNMSTSRVDEFDRGQQMETGADRTEIFNANFHAHRPILQKTVLRPFMKCVGNQRVEELLPFQSQMLHPRYSGIWFTTHTVVNYLMRSYNN